jgi:ppGpp synthetase/RelA/SpoT-type nucleotidyltranferase
MAFVKPEYSKSDVNKAGKILVLDIVDDEGNFRDLEQWFWAYDVLANWRACHGYPINTFQALLRKRLGDTKNALVAQRLKRAPSVIAKLRRFRSMNLSQMQDIGGLRAVVSSMTRLKTLTDLYRGSKFKHELVSSKDYISNPKRDGYRSIHMVYRYKNGRAPDYNGLLLELQFRTQLQHAWATAVETMGTFLGQALKSGEGERPWRMFFEIASAAFAVIEGTAKVPGYESLRSL